MKKKVVKRRIKRRKGKSKLYFSAETQAAIEEFQATDDNGERDVIYTKNILPAF